MSFEAWVGTIGGILAILGVVFTFLYKMFRSGIIEETNLNFTKVYKYINEGTTETFEAHQRIRIDMSALIEKRILETENIRKENVALMRKNDSDQITNINSQVSEMKLDTARQLSIISVDLKVMAANMVVFSEKLVEHKTKIESLEKIK